MSSGTLISLNSHLNFIFKQKVPLHFWPFVQWFHLTIQTIFKMCYRLIFYYSCFIKNYVSFFVSLVSSIFSVPSPFIIFFDVKITLTLHVFFSFKFDFSQCQKRIHLQFLHLKVELCLVWHCSVRQLNSIDFHLFRLRLRSFHLNLVFVPYF